MIEDKIMAIMDTIEYGFLDENGHNIITSNPQKWEDEFYQFYYLLTPEELLEKRCGVCWDQVELERKLFEEENIPVQTYFICTYDGDNLPSHTFLTYEKDNTVYWVESSWPYKGIHPYPSIEALLKDVKKKFREDHPANDDSYTFIFAYSKPPAHIGCEEFYKYCESQTLVKLNPPLYFYHLVNKDSDLSSGLLSLQYMYEHHQYSLFDQHAQKYKSRIVNSWNITKYKSQNEDDLTREDILDALCTFRGIHGASYIYFFRYPPYKELGPEMMKLLQRKDIYRININDEALQRKIKDIFYGYDGSHSDNPLLTKEYYEKVSEQDYFSTYDEGIEMYFSKLNHIAIAFEDDFCPKEFLEKYEG
ncbi:MAG: hypothetical protein K2M17_01910 [Bacilli bacterium]|nr:hypothetical protein [Bacilli bacterium]